MTKRNAYIQCIYIPPITRGTQTVTKVQKWGNSLAIRIPRALAGQMAVREGTEVDLEVRDGELTVRPNRKKMSLNELLKNCKPSQLHGETDFGPDQGREVID